ncbi:MAG: integrase core domain-containing protein [Pseudomonadota bacterium]
MLFIASDLAFTQIVAALAVGVYEPDAQNFPEAQEQTARAHQTRPSGIAAPLGRQTQAVLGTQQDIALVFRSAVFRRALAAIGIRHEFSEPGKPWQNGCIERFFLTLKQTCLSMEWPWTTC